ncbi:hypothetical protein RJ641_012084 [Dillenia turbinata]|uniref:C2H2-type domain-containing protein n=1 Tax=Dillenia turbinata TaxID=194707 RepID=A0AAN8V2M7_9MAGN
MLSKTICVIPPADRHEPLNSFTPKRKRRPAGTPDPDAEVVSLSPKTLLESDRYVCEICNQGFQREQNLQMHKRRHRVPWKLLKRSDGNSSETMKKRVYVCPEPMCLHHDPSHALGDLVGIKKHYRRKHSNHKQWVCEKCSKGYAVQSDYKAHLKTCGTRGHSCDCGRVFSRVESFIEHQDTCNLRRVQPESHFNPLQPASSCTSPSNDTNFSPSPLPALTKSKPMEAIFLIPNHPNNDSPTNDSQVPHNLQLQLLMPNNPLNIEDHATNLGLSLGSSWENEGEIRQESAADTTLEVTRLKEVACEQLKLAMAEKAFAEEARQQAKKHIELAELDYENARRIRQQALQELKMAQSLKEQATKKISSTLLQVTCQACKQLFQTSTLGEDTSVSMSYISYASICEGGED